jgi:hypothetical protein
MSQTLPRHLVLHKPAHWPNDPLVATWPWPELAPLPPLRLADGSGPAQQQTTVRLCYDAAALYLRFDCQDDDIWGTYGHRDDPIYDEEVVELFLGPGQADLTRYFEIEISPNGVLFDAAIYNPTSQRSELEIDTGWDGPGLAWQAGRADEANHWWATLTIPWAAVSPSPSPARLWRANFYRIERPRHGQTEFSCWSPTMTEPADFHKPAYFGYLELG